MSTALVESTPTLNGRAGFAGAKATVVVHRMLSSKYYIGTIVFKRAEEYKGDIRRWSIRRPGCSSKTS
jgi:hypothetical protein